MWIVYNREDAPIAGWLVSSEKEAIRECRANPELTYTYIG